MQLPLQTCIFCIVVVGSLVALTFSGVTQHPKMEISSYGQVVNSNGERSSPSQTIAEQRAIGMMISNVPAFVGSMHTRYEIALQNPAAFINHTILFIWEVLTPSNDEIPILAFGNKYIHATPKSIIFRVANQVVSVPRGATPLNIRTTKRGSAHMLFMNKLEAARIYEKNWVPDSIITLNYKQPSSYGGHVIFDNFTVYGHGA